MALNMEEFAQSWFQGPSQPAATAPAPQQVPAQVAPPPVAQPQQPPPQSGFVQWRRCPDGSTINNEYVLDWGGEVGDPYARVQLRHHTGPIIFDGVYAELLQQQIPNVWIPGATVVDDQTGQPIAATAHGDGFSGMGATAPKRNWRSTAKKVIGGGLVLGSLGAAIYAGWGMWKTPKKRREED